MLLLLVGLCLLIAWGPRPEAIALVGPLWGAVAAFWLRMNGKAAGG